MDSTTDISLLDMYFYAVVFILTAITSVGYGANMTTPLEYMFVIVLEMLSVAVVALFISVIDVYMQIK